MTAHVLRRHILAAALAAFALSAAAEAQETGKETGKETIKLGFIGPLSGGNAQQGLSARN